MGFLEGWGWDGGNMSLSLSLYGMNMDGMNKG
jgi:hypothetical protein